MLDQLGKRGVKHIFGVPGDYVLRFYDLIEQSPLQHIGTTREDAAGFAADAYARVRGLGAVCVTYCVGGLSLANPIAGAYAEKSPIVVISGAPGLKERERNPLLHHRVRDFSTQREVFERITVASAALEDPDTAYHEIDRVLQAVERYKRPGYIELPRDMVDVVAIRIARAAAARRGGGCRSVGGVPGRSHGDAQRQPPAGDPGRRRGASLRAPGSPRPIGRTGRGFPSPRRCWASRSSARIIRCTWACTKGRWATPRCNATWKKPIAC